MESIDESTEDCFFRPQTLRKISSESLCSSKRSSTISLISQGSLHRLIKEANEDPTTENELLEEILVISFNQEIQDQQGCNCV